MVMIRTRPFILIITTLPASARTIIVLAVCEINGRHVAIVDQKTLPSDLLFISQRHPGDSHLFGQFSVNAALSRYSNALCIETAAELVVAECFTNPNCSKVIFPSCSCS